MSDFRDDMREWRHRKWEKRQQMWTCWKCSRKTDGKLCRIGLEDCPERVMKEKAWIVYDARYEFDTDAASVLELYAEQEKPSWSQLHEDWGGMSAFLVECDVKHEDGRNLLVNHRTLGVIQ